MFWHPCRTGKPFTGFLCKNNILIKTSVLIPAYNEQATIIEILSLVAQQAVDGIEFEMIVRQVKTVELLEKTPNLYSKIIKPPNNHADFHPLDPLAGCRKNPRLECLYLIL